MGRRPAHAPLNVYLNARLVGQLRRERSGAIENLNTLPASTGAAFSPRAEYEPVYDRLLGEQTRVFTKLFET